MPSKLNLTNQRFGRLLVIGEAPQRGERTHWLCRCDCGTVKEKVMPAMQEITQREWDIMHDTLEAYIMHLRVTEPRAIKTISALKEAQMSLPFSIEEIFGD